MAPAWTRVPPPGREWAATVLDRVTTRLEELRRFPGVVSADRVDLALEEIYVALLAGGRRKPVMAALLDEEEEPVEDQRRNEAGVLREPGEARATPSRRRLGRREGVGRWRDLLLHPGSVRPRTPR